MKNSFLIWWGIPCCLFFLCSCEQGPLPLEKGIIGTVGVQLNPNKRVPLGALLQFSTREDCQVELTVTGNQPVQRTFSRLNKYHEVPVIGLYPDANNTVEILLRTEKGREYVGQVQIQTPALPEVLPTIEVKQASTAEMEPGFHLIDMLIANNGKFLTYTIMFDNEGKIRWFMDMSETGQITYTSYRLQNGNWLYLNWIDLIEVDDLGKEIKKEQMWGNAGNHELIELPNGQLLMGGSAKDVIVLNGGKQYVSRYDHAVIWDRVQNRTAKSWDLRQILDVDRMVYPPDYTPDYQADWFHVNAIDLDQRDNSLVISGRNQGVVKVNQNNELIWILAPHKDWGKAGPTGNGLSTSDYLLTALDQAGNPLPEPVQSGEAGTENFEWPTGQHAAQVLENGNILLFDNGLMRNFSSQPSYSRAVEYKIDEQQKTIQQVWSYGKDLGLELFSAITSDVDVLPQTGNRLIVAGNIRAGQDPPHAKLLEVTYPDNKVVFEARVYFKDLLGTKERSWAQFDLVFRGARYDLVPD